MSQEEDLVSNSVFEFLKVFQMDFQLVPKHSSPASN